MREGRRRRRVSVGNVVVDLNTLACIDELLETEIMTCPLLCHLFLTVFSLLTVR
jgi:hypothetical protein